VKVGRNEPCSCGSGRKVKRCCGVDGARERAPLRSEALEELLDLAWHFPRYRACGEAFQVWAAAAPDVRTQEAVNTGLSLLREAECERILDRYATEQPQAWRSLLGDYGDETEAAMAMLAGAVVAAVDEAKRPLDFPLAMIEITESVRADPAHVLTAALDPHDLWSVVETAKADEALAATRSDRDFEHALAREAARLATPWHALRLLALCDRLEARLPHPRYPKASTTLSHACAQVRVNPALAERVRRELLFESVAQMSLAA